jgi:hypothetical protein
MPVHLLDVWASTGPFQSFQGCGGSIGPSGSAYSALADILSTESAEIWLNEDAEITQLTQQQNLALSAPPSVLVDFCAMPMAYYEAPGETSFGLDSYDPNRWLDFEEKLTGGWLASLGTSATFIPPAGGAGGYPFGRGLVTGVDLSRYAPPAGGTGILVNTSAPHAQTDVSGTMVWIWSMFAVIVKGWPAYFYGYGSDAPFPCYLSFPQGLPPTEYGGWIKEVLAAASSSSAAGSGTHPGAGSASPAPPSSILAAGAAAAAAVAAGTFLLARGRLK